MKGRFLEKKKELKSICLDYLHEGEWLETKRKENKPATDS
jgi:hypothetical protein